VTVKLQTADPLQCYMNESNTWTHRQFTSTIWKQRAGVVQWQNWGFPSFGHGFSFLLAANKP